MRLITIKYFNRLTALIYIYIYIYIYSVSHRILWHLWRQVMSHINLRIYDIASSLQVLALLHFSTLWTVTYCNTTECPIKLFTFTYFLLSYIKQYVLYTLGGGSECTALAPPSIPRLSKAPNPQLLPGRCSINDCPLRRVCVQILGHHTWLYVKSLFFLSVPIIQKAFRISFLKIKKCTKITVRGRFRCRVEVGW